MALEIVVVIIGLLLGLAHLIIEIIRLAFEVIDRFPSTSQEAEKATLESGKDL